MANDTISSLIASNLKAGLPHPGYVEQNIPPQVIHFPGMNHRGIPQQVLDHYAREAGLPSSDLPKLIGEAVVHLIETQGNSEIVTKTELESLRKAAEELGKLRGGDDEAAVSGGAEIGSGPDADGSVDGQARDSGD
jgi:hypothetical protein